MVRQRWNAHRDRSDLAAVTGGGKGAFAPDRNSIANASLVSGPPAGQRQNCYRLAKIPICFDAMQREASLKAKTARAPTDALVFVDRRCSLWQQCKNLNSASPYSVTSVRRVLQASQL